MTDNNEYWAYLFQIAKEESGNEINQDEDERAFSCGAEMHLSDSKSPLGDLGEISETSSKCKIKTNAEGEEL